MDAPSRRAVAILPDDAIVEILARVPARSVYRSRCVAKVWRDLIDDPLHRKKLPQTLEGFFFTDSCGAKIDFGFINVLPRSVPLDIDPCFSFLTKLPEIQRLYLRDSCNGLLLFEHHDNSEEFDTLEYILCNPATKLCWTVPTCDCCPQPMDCISFLVFDPAISSHFHLIQFWEEDLDDEGEPLGDDFMISMHAYSSKVGTWSHSQTDWDEQGQLERWRYKGRYSRERAFVNGILHLIVLTWDPDYVARIVALDEQGKTQRMITLPPLAEGSHRRPVGCIGQSQGRLHYINQDIVARDPDQSYELSIWVLQDYDTQVWVLKDTVSFLKLFGRMTAIMLLDFDVVTIHQDCNVVFFLQGLSCRRCRMIAYDMDHKEMSVIGTFENGYGGWSILPYTPYFSDSPALTDKH